MVILIVEPGCPPRRAEIDGSLQAMQKVVGGKIQALYPYEESVALVCNDEGKILNLPPNRCLLDENGEVYDIICGTFFLCNAPPNSKNFEGLTEAQVSYYTAQFRHPLIFIS